MRVDAWTKQLFPGILATMLMIVAYLQASALAHLFAAHLGGSAISTIPQALREQVRAVVTPTERKADGSAILARNPFDSITGPFNKDDEPTIRVDPERKNQENPYTDPVCDSGRVLLITTADDPSWSFAAIAIGTEKATLRRIGDGVGGRVIHAMVWDRVWMLEGTLRCQLPLHREMGITADNAKKPDESANRKARPRGALPPDIAEKIRTISDTQYDVDRSVIEAVMDKRGELFRTVRIMPTRDADGAGLKLSGIKNGSLLSSLGIANGDKLQTINGFEMSDPMIAMQAYQRLLTADKLDVRVVRGGKPVTIEINLH